MPLYRWLQRNYKAHMTFVAKKNIYLMLGWEVWWQFMWKKEWEQMWIFLYYQPSVSSYTLISSISHTTQAHSCKNGLLKDDCTPASILEFKSTTYHLWLLTIKVKSTVLTENPTRHKFLMINQLMVKMFQSPLKIERGPVVSVPGEEFRTLLLRIYQSSLDVISSACKHRVITGVSSNTSQSVKTK